MSDIPVVATLYIDGKPASIQVLGSTMTSGGTGTFHLNPALPLSIGRPFVSSGPALQQPQPAPKPATEAHTIHCCSHCGQVCEG